MDIQIQLLNVKLLFIISKLKNCFDYIFSLQRCSKLLIYARAKYLHTSQHVEIGLIPLNLGPRLVQLFCLICCIITMKN